MTIWVLKSPSTGNDYTPEELKERLNFLANSAKNGTSRFGWSWLDEADLNKIQDKNWPERTQQEIDFWKAGNFLKEINAGDWIVHVNLPDWGKCIAGQVVEGYSFEESSNEYGDYRHMIKIDPNTVVEFSRNDERVEPIIYSKLVLRSRYWRIYDQKEFLQTIENLKSEKNEFENGNAGLLHLKKKLSSPLEDFTKLVQNTHPSAKLEAFIAEVFRKVPGVKEVKENGRYKGFGTDYGADLIVVYRAGLPIADLEKEEILVVQVKSYINDHWETDAVSQIETAIAKFEAAAGIIITTGNNTEQLQKAADDLEQKLGKKISLIAGQDVAKFILTHGSSLLFQSQV